MTKDPSLVEIPGFADVCLDWAPAWALVAPGVRYHPPFLELLCSSGGFIGDVSTE